MGRTLAEKIFSSHSGKEVKAGDFVIADLDCVMAHDTTCALALEPFREIKISDKVFDPKKIVITFDHAFPSPALNSSKLHTQILKFARKQGIGIITDGVCHQILAEKHIKPGDLVLGADSHTPTGGALGAVAIGVGSTDAAIAFATGKCWFRVPDTMRIKINGKMPHGVYAKDVALEVAKKLGPDGAVYKVVEYRGPAVDEMDVSSRLTLTNMAAEMGAKSAIVAPDEKTRRYLEENGRGQDFLDLKSDPDAWYEQQIEFDISKLEPNVACPPDINNVECAACLEKGDGVRVDQVFVGSCANCRIEDLEVVYKIWKGRKPCDGLRVIVTPASRKVWEQALERGYLAEFSRFGAVITSPNCGLCFGRFGGVIDDGEVCVSTSNRNFKGRMGSPKGLIYLASPATAAASAITGKITDPRQFLN